MCFVDVNTAFDRVMLNEFVNVLKEKQILNNIIEVVKKLNMHTINPMGQILSYVKTVKRVREKLKLYTIPTMLQKLK